MRKSEPQPRTAGMMEAADLCEHLACWMFDFEECAPELLEKARVLFLDSCILAIAARNTKSAQALDAFDISQHGSCTRWDGKGMATASDATFTNALLAHALFQDDCEMTSWSHPGSFVVPAALASAEETNASVGRLLRGLVLGYAVSAWWGADEEVARTLIERGMRCSPNLAPFAAAATFAYIGGWTASEMKSALAAASLMGRGALQAVGGGGDDWRWQNASAARDGVMCALVARNGLMSGACKSLEGPNGFLRAYCGLKTIPERWRTMPNPRSILSVWNKAYPTLGDNMAPAIAACQAHLALGEDVAVSAVLSMNAHFAHFPGTQRRRPYHSTTEAVASVRFTVALGLLYGDIASEDYTNFMDEKVAELSDRIDVVADDSLSYTQARLIVHVSDGRILDVLPVDLPAHKFYRDKTEAVAVAQKMLGPAGEAIAKLVFAIDLDEPAAKLSSRMSALVQ